MHKFFSGNYWNDQMNSYRGVIHNSIGEHTCYQQDDSPSLLDIHNNPDYYPIESYLKFPPTNNCYLDGRYFNKVFAGYSGLCNKPLNIEVINTNGKNETNASMDYCSVCKDVPILIKTNILIGNEFLHSALVIIKPENEQGERHVIFFDPIELDENSASLEDIQFAINFIGSVIESFLSTRIRNIVFEIDTIAIEKPKTDCLVAGFCNAHIILYALNYLEGIPYYPNEIQRFAKLVEEGYPLCSACPPEIEYGALSPGTKGALIGGLGGLALGGLAGGPTGALVGAAAGGIGGYAIGSLA